MNSNRLQLRAILSFSVVYKMATYDRFTPVNIRVNYNMNSAESTDAFKNLQTKILDKFSSPGVEIARDSVDIERIYRKFFVKVCVCGDSWLFFPLDTRTI